MFDEPKYIQNVFNIVFPRQILIRRLANDFEDMLKDNYAQPQIISIPDELDFQVPRIIFESAHGYSRILISQVSISLNITYSPDWQRDITKGSKYLLNRMPIIYDLIDNLLNVNPHFCGLTTLVRLPGFEADKEILSCLSKLFLKNSDISDTHDIQVKLTKVLSNKFFSNVMIQNYRIQKLDRSQQDIMPAPHRDISEIGIQIVGDYNDRYAFNEIEDYYSTRDKADEVISGGFKAVSETIKQILEGGL